MLTANILFALVWALLLSFSPGNLVVGFLVGFVLIWLTRGGAAHSEYVRRVRAAIALALFTIWELTKANVRVAYFTVSSLDKLKPAVISIPLTEDATNEEITLLSMLITLTPGTRTLDVADDRSEIYVHFMHAGDPAQEVEGIKSGFERKILAVTRALA